MGKHSKDESAWSEGFNQADTADDLLTVHEQDLRDREILMRAHEVIVRRAKKKTMGLGLLLSTLDKLADHIGEE
jgi:hypothetical protein